MTRLANRAERIKLARALGADPGELAYLDPLPVTQIRRMRTAALEQVFVDKRQAFQRLAAFLIWVPSVVLAFIAKRFLPALVLARVASELSAHKAAAIARRLPPALLADVTLHLDPRRAPDLIRLIPDEVIIDAALELVRRGDYITMGQFVDFLRDDSIRQVIDAIEDEAELLHIVFFVESRNRLDHLVKMMPQERLRKTILLVLDTSRDVMIEILSLVAHVSYALKYELGELAAAQDEAVLTRIIRTAHEQALWADLLPVVATLSEPTLRKVVNLPLLKQDPAILQGILQAADEHRLWLTVLPLVGMLDDAMRTEVAEFGAQLPHAAKQQVADAALIGEHWVLLADIVARMSGGAQAEIGGILRQYGDVDPQLLDRLTRLADKYGFGDHVRS